MELERLYRYLKESPRDARWMMRRVGTDYQDTVEALRQKGWPVAVRLDDVGGLHRAVYLADDQGELFPPEAKPKRRRRRRPKRL